MQRVYCDLTGYGGRVFGDVEAIITAYMDMRTDWYAGEQQILQIRDALWPAVLCHEKLGGTVSGAIEAWAREGRGLGYEEMAGVEHWVYELLWGVRQQWMLSGGRAV
jgi:hypothetical protein